MKILIVEDDFFSRKLLMKYLSSCGEVDIAANGKEALKAVLTELENNRKYDLICLDIMMPEMDGQQVLQAIRQLEENFKIRKEQGAKIFMTTALSDKDNVMQAAVGGCDAYLIKPITRSKLFEELEMHGISCG